MIVGCRDSVIQLRWLQLCDYRSDPELFLVYVLLDKNLLDVIVLGVTDPTSEPPNKAGTISSPSYHGKQDCVVWFACLDRF